MNRTQDALVRTFALVAALSAAAGASAAETHWDYAHGTEGWGLADPAYATCSNGMTQSPIDVIGSLAARTSLPALNFNYGTSVTLTMTHNGHTVVATPTTATNTLTIAGKIYTLAQFHMHAPSENYLNGEQYPLEYHFVHRAADGSRAVVGVFFDDAAAANPQLAQLIEGMPEVEDPDAVSGFNLRAMMPTGRSYRFAGSLTTPPCDEGIAWHVMATVRTGSAGQIATFQQMFSGSEFPGGNRRPVQSRNARRITTEY